MFFLIHVLFSPLVRPTTTYAPTFDASPIACVHFTAPSNTLTIEIQEQSAQQQQDEKKTWHGKDVPQRTTSHLNGAHNMQKTARKWTFQLKIDLWIHMSTALVSRCSIVGCCRSLPQMHYTGCDDNVSDWVPCMNASPRLCCAAARPYR